MCALLQGIGYRLMREPGLARGLYNVTLLGAVYFFGRIMRDVIDIIMAILAFVTTMGAGFEQLGVDVKQPESTLLVNPAHAPMLMANQAVDDLIGLDGRERSAEESEYKSCQEYL